MRRAVLLVVGALAVGGYCLGAEPQQRVHRIGLLNPGTEVPAGFIQGLRKFGYVEGQNIFIEIRNAGGKAENLPGLLGDLSNRGVSVIVANGSTAVGVALKATKSIPIVMVSGGNPVRRGFVKSLSVPGGNVTGLSSAAPGVSAKRIELAKECLPWLARVVVLKPLSRRSGVSGYRRVAETLGIDYHVVDLSGDADLDRALARIKALRPDAFITVRELVTVHNAQRIADYALKNNLPSMFEAAEFVRAGGLISYGINHAANWPRAVVFVDRILKGANPATLPVEPPQLELVINLKTAEKIGVKIPPEILLEANEVIK